MKFHRFPRIVLYCVMIITLCLSSVVLGDQSEDREMVQPRRLIDTHTAGILPKAFFDFEARVYPSGKARGSGLSLGISVGITDRLNIGLSYGGDGIIGRGKIKGNPYPGGLIKYRLFEEGSLVPAVAIGYEHQGYGGIEKDSYTGFIYKSQGLFLALSKNFILFSTVQFGLHTSVNYSFEESDVVRWPNCFVGMDIGLNEELALLMEYDFALNQKDPYYDTYAKAHRGFLNFGIRWAFVSSFYLELELKDVLENRRLSSSEPGPMGWSRELKLVYITNF